MGGNSFIMNLIRSVCQAWISLLAGAILLIIGALSAPLQATIQVSVTSLPASPQPLGTSITFTASATDSNPGPVTYSFAWQMAGGTGFNLIRDFSLTNTLRWTPNIQEGTYQIQVTARDYLANETSSTVVTFVVNPLVVGDPPVAVKTAHPLVALFSAPSCPTGSSMRIGFELNGSTQMNYTNFRTCHPPTSMNFYVAGMLAKSTYNMHYEVETGSTIVPDSNVVSFTTGAIPKSAPMATTSVVLPPTSQSAVSSDILFTGYTIEPYSAIDYPAATDLSGNVLWYFPGYGQITRMVTGNALLGTTRLLNANCTGTSTGPFGTNVLQQVLE